jgi:hypothetical protein
MAYQISGKMGFRQFHNQLHKNVGPIPQVIWMANSNNKHAYLTEKYKYSQIR